MIVVIFGHLFGLQVSLKGRCEPTLQAQTAAHWLTGITINSVDTTGPSPTSELKVRGSTPNQGLFINKGPKVTSPILTKPTSDMSERDISETIPAHQD